MEAKSNIERLSHANDIKSLKNTIEEKLNELKLKDIEIAENRLKLTNELQSERTNFSNEIIYLKRIIEEKHAQLKIKEAEVIQTFY